MKKVKNFIKNILKIYFSFLVKISCKNHNNCKVFGYSKLTNNTFLGKNVNFNGFKVLGKGKVVINDNFHSGSNCSIITQVHNYKGNSLPYDDTYIIKETHIEENVWIGNNVIILGGVRIGEGAIIQAGSVVVSDIPPLAIAGGHPAKVFSARDKSHYFSLKTEKNFH